MKGITLILLFVSCPSLFASVIISPSPNPPVELSSFTGQVEDGSVHLFWNTESEINNLGFAIERAEQIGQWQEIGFVEGSGTTNKPQTYEFLDSLVNIVAEKIYYRLKQIDFDGTFQYSELIEISLQQITLRDTTNQYDYIIITVPEFVNACEPFKLHKETVRDFRTLIVDTTQIFAEFDSNFTRQGNIRDFISYAGTFWKDRKPKFFLIVGNITAIPNFNVQWGTYQANSDYYYTQNIYDIDTTIYDFFVGRIPATNTTEIIDHLDKVISYESDQTVLNWMNNNLFICEDDTLYHFLQAAFDISENYLPDFIRSSFIANTDTSIYYGNKDSIYREINKKGTAVVWFEGRHTDSVFISQDFGLNDLSGFNNESKYFLTVFVATQHSISDSNTNLAKEMLVQKNAGSLGGFVFTGPSFWGAGKNFQYDWAQSLFDPDVNSIGEAMDVPPSIGMFYYYQKQIANLWADPSLKLKYDTTVDVEKVTDEIPQSFTLYQNYPNPFNPTTTIKFALPVNSRVKINVYNSLGQLVETLVDKEMESGYHEINFDASSLASGVYLYQLQANDYVSVKKMVIIK